MRRVRIHNINNKPLAIVAVGVEQIVSDHMPQPSKYEDQELRAMQRSPKKLAGTGSLFSILTRQLFWENTSHQS